jgi:hypothetical protein
MVRAFLDNVEPQNKQPPNTYIGTKRKRSQGVTSPQIKLLSPGCGPSIQNALVLIVLALGRICLWKDKVPEILPAERLGTAMVYDGSSQPSHQAHYTLSNGHVIPGLDYFACAINIINQHSTECQLEHILAKILACLYHGQLGRPAQSYYYIHEASDTLLDFLKP